MRTFTSHPKYRYFALIIFMLLTVVIELQWLTHAAVLRPAEHFYANQFSATSFFNLDFMAMSYMLTFLLMSFPASYLIHKWGVRNSLALAAGMVIVFSVAKAYFASSFWGVVLAQSGLALAQPLILNAVTAFSVRWFAISERGLAAGLLALAQYIGILLAMLLTPALVGSTIGEADYGQGFEYMLWVYAGFSVAAALLSLVFMREQVSGANTEPLERYSFGEGFRFILKQRDMVITVVLFFIGLGIFNAVSSMTDSITAQLGVQDSDGLIGGALLIGGIIGAAIMPVLSDKYRKRKPFLVVCIAGLLPGILGLSFANQLSTDTSTVYTIALASSFVLGFFVMSAGPIGFQYAAEVSAPAPETLSQGILLWVGQLSGMFFVAGMSRDDNAYLSDFMILFSLLSVATLVGVMFLRESPVFKSK